MLVPAEGQKLPEELRNIIVSWRYLNNEYGKKLLEKNENNRNISAQRVNRYLSDMTRPDGWKINGDTIRKDHTGNLMDGQQRADAARRLPDPDMGQWILEVDGLSPEAQSTIDTGRTRSFADMLKLNHGEANSMTLSAITRRAYLWEVAGVRWDLFRSSASHDAMALYLYGDEDAGLPDNSEMLRWATQHAVQARKDLFGIMAPSTFGVMLYLTATFVDEDLATEFWVDGVRFCDEIPKSHPAQRLRRVLARNSEPVVRNVDTPAVLAFCITAWNEFITDERSSSTTIISPRTGWDATNMPTIKPVDHRDYPFADKLDLEDDLEEDLS
jgi:hypothetical protein